MQVTRGGIALGMPRDRALSVAARWARDSMPPLRQTVLAYVARKPGSMTSEVVTGVQLPRTTVDRTLQELHLFGLPYGESVRWAYQVAPDVAVSALARLAGNVTTP